MERYSINKGNKHNLSKAELEAIVNMFRQQRYDECIKEVKSKLKQSPNSLHLLNYQAMAYSALKKDREALNSYQKILKRDPTLAGPYYNMGIILKRNGRTEEAVESYKKAISLKSDYVQAYNNLGALYKDNENYDNAIKMFTKAKEIQPDHQNSFYNLALIKKEQGLNEEAIELFLKLLDLNPEHNNAKSHAKSICNELGIKSNNEGNYSSALKYFNIVTLLDPSDSTGYYNMGNTYFEMKDFKKAKNLFKKSLKLESKYESSHSNLGAVYRNMGEIEKSLSCYDEAIKINPENPNNYYNKAITFREAERIDEAEKTYRQAIGVDPKHINSYHNLALIHEERGQIKEGLHIAKKVLSFENKHPEINHSIAIMNLQLGHMSEGWKFNEYRWKVSPHNKVVWPFTDKPVWQGERGKRVVLWKEQGIGDDIIFLSLAPEVRQMVSTLYVYVDPRLQPLCKRAMPEIEFVKDLEELQNLECDYHLPLISLGGVIRNDISDFERTVKGYLKADPQRVESIRNELQLDGKTVIGISWKSFNSLNQIKKSVQLRDMGRLFSGLDVVLVNLQYGDVEDEIKEFKKETGIEVVQCASVDNKEDLDGLAALIEVCDLVVSTSNATIHLAGSLAKETWVLLHYVSIYYWLVERTDSVWYPSLRLYRQPTLNDWDSVYASVRKDLEKEL